MNINYSTTAALLLLCALSAYGQVDLRHIDADYPDSLQKCSIRYFSPGKGGKDRVWDFSRKLSSKKSQKVMICKDSADIISITDDGRMGYYYFRSDTLMLLGTESPKETRNYRKKKAVMRFPLVYNDSICKSFRCEGVYCGTHPFRELGSTVAKVDAEGVVVMAEGDTVRNVKRVHTIDSYSVCMDISYAALDTAKLTQVIDERHAWYLPESEYPVIEDVTSTTFLNMDAIGTTRSAYCNLPEYKVSDYITEVDEYTDEGQDGSFDELAESDIIHYMVETNGSKVVISYDLDDDACISTVVASHMGVTYRHCSWTQKAGQGYCAQIDCGGLRRGTYILYINVNGKVYSEKVNIE